VATLPPAPKLEKYLVVRMNNRADLAKFIDDLVVARKASKDTGGVYSAFVKLANGQTLQIEIGLPIEEADNA
jgi:hypothetical protein